jgi:AraC-like DNA-binding protein
MPHAQFSTADLPARDRVAVYREVISRSVGNFHVDPTAEGFSFEATATTLPRLSIARIASGPVRAQRTAKMAADDTRDITLAIFHEGRVSVSQLGRDVTVENGGAILLSSRDPIVMHRTAARLTNLSVLRSDIAPMVSDLDAAVATAVPHDSEAMRLLTGYCDVVTRRAGVETNPLDDLAAAHLLDLMALAIGATGEAEATARGGGLKAARHARLFAEAARFLALRFGDPELKPDLVARRLGVSSRLLHKVFAERGETVMDRLWRERVNRAAHLLDDPDAADRSVTDIAFACGFNDSSHFCRVFACRIGMAPSRWRKRAH